MTPEDIKALESCSVEDLDEEEWDEILRGLRDLTDQKNGAYGERNKCVALIARMALALGWRVGLGEHPPTDRDWDADWRTIVFVDSPAGQLSWHFHDSEAHLVRGLPLYPGTWDGHDTSEKYRRVQATLAPSLPEPAR